MGRLLKALAILIITFSIIITYNNYSQGYTNSQREARDSDKNGKVTVSELIDFYNEDETRTVLVEDVKEIVEAGRVDELDDEAIMAANNAVNNMNKADPNQDYSWITKFEKEIQSRNLHVLDSSGGQTTYGEETKGNTTKSYKEQGYSTNLEGRNRDLDEDGVVTTDELVVYYNDEENIHTFILYDIERLVASGKINRLTDNALKRAEEFINLPSSKSGLVEYDKETGEWKKPTWVERFEKEVDRRFGTESEDDNNDNEGKSNTAGEAGTADEIMQKADNWISAGEQAYKDENSINKGLFESTVEQAYNLLLAIGFVVIVIVGVILAIQFMLASADQKAIIKQKMLPYLTGCCVIFGAFGIWGMVIRLFGDPSGVSEYGKIGNLGSVEDADMIKTLGNNIIGILQIAGSFIAIIMLIVLGIKYMIGSAEEKAEYKVTMKNYVVGALLLFGIVNFIGAVQTMALGIFG